VRCKKNIQFLWWSILCALSDKIPFIIAKTHFFSPLTRMRFVVALYIIRISRNIPCFCSIFQMFLKTHKLFNSYHIWEKIYKKYSFYLHLSYFSLFKNLFKSTKRPEMLMKHIEIIDVLKWIASKMCDDNAKFKNLFKNI